MSEDSVRGQVRAGRSVDLAAFRRGEVVRMAIRGDGIDLEGSVLSALVLGLLSPPGFGVGSTTYSKFQCQTDVSVAAGES